MNSKARWTISYSTPASGCSLTAYAELVEWVALDNCIQASLTVERKAVASADPQGHAGSSGMRPGNSRDGPGGVETSTWQPQREQGWIAPPPCSLRKDGGQTQAHRPGSTPALQPPESPEDWLHTPKHRCASMVMLWLKVPPHLPSWTPAAPSSSHTPPSTQGPDPPVPGVPWSQDPACLSPSHHKGSTVVDFIRPLLKTDQGQKCILVIVDYGTHYLEVVPLQKATSHVTWELLLLSR